MLEVPEEVVNLCIAMYLALEVPGGFLRIGFNFSSFVGSGSTAL